MGLINAIKKGLCQFNPEIDLNWVLDSNFKGSKLLYF